MVGRSPFAWRRGGRGRGQALHPDTTKAGPKIGTGL
jgi:hypothetical protein